MLFSISAMLNKSALRNIHLIRPLVVETYNANIKNSYDKVYPNYQSTGFNVGYALKLK